MKVLCALPIKSSFQVLGPKFAAASGVELDTEWAGMLDIRRRILAGEAADLIFGSAAMLKELQAEGRLLEGSLTDIASSGVYAAVRAGAPKPDLGSAEALQAALLAAKSIIYSSGPSGVYLAELFAKWGIAERIRATQAKPGVLCGERVASGEYELGFQQLPELLPVAGIDLVGPLPEGVQTYTMFSGAIPASATDAEAAQALLHFLRSPGGAAVLREKGMLPAAG